MADCNHPSCAERPRCKKAIRLPKRRATEGHLGQKLVRTAQAVDPDAPKDGRRAPQQNIVVFRSFVGGFLDWVHGRDERKYGVKWLWKTLCDKGELGAAARLYVDLTEFVAPKLARMEHAAAEGENLNIAVINYAPNGVPARAAPELPAPSPASAAEVEVVDGRPAR